MYWQNLVIFFSANYKHLFIVYLNSSLFLCLWLTSARNYSYNSLSCGFKNIIKFNVVIVQGVLRMSVKKVVSKQVSGFKKTLAAVVFLSSALSVSSAFAASESIALQNVDKFIANEKVDTSNSNWKLQLNKPPLQQFTQGKQYIWKLKTTQGDIEIKLLPKTAPMHVSSTLYLTRLGFYDNIVFHRVIQGFMAQGGDPTGTGRRGPGYTYDGEFSPAVKHNKPGLLSMANSGPGTDGSQFFLTFIPTNWLDGKHTIFGEVTKGMNVVKALESFGSKSGKTSKKLSILEATIEVR